MQSIRNGILSIGLVNVPVGVATAVKDSDLRFKTLHEKCKTPISQRLWCETCGTEAHETVKGYEVAKGSYIEITQSDLDSIAPARSKVIELKKFTPLDEINDLLRNKPYWLTPAQPLETGYGLMWAALREAECNGLGITTMWGKEHPCLVEARAYGLMLWTLNQTDDLMVPDFKMPEVSDREVKEAVRLVKAYRFRLEATDFKLPSREALSKMIGLKLKGKKPVPVKQLSTLPSADLMTVMRETIKASSTAKVRGTVKS